MNEEEMVNKVFARINEFLNSNNQILFNVEELKVVWAMKDGYTMKGFLRIGKKHVRFWLVYNKNTGAFEFWIPGIGAMVFKQKTVEKFLEEVKEEEEK
ncbi:hypothetical protein [Saccharolobus islandicus]|nr:hypothetical protein [Sulfolobus islandicus]